MSQYAHLSEPDPEWLQFLSTRPKPSGPPPPLAQRGRFVSQLVQANHKLWDPPYPESGLDVVEKSIPVDGASIQVRTYVPEAKADEKTFPLLVWFHMGGFVIGDLEFDDALLRLLCVNLRISCVNVGYRLAPEHTFPIPLDDCYRATKWAAANTDILSVDLTKGFIVGGSSAGGTLSAIIALKSRDDSSFKTKLTGQVLQVPSVCPAAVYPEKWKRELLSYEQNKDGMMTTKMIEEILAIYAPPDLTSPDVAPLLAATHDNLPAAYLQICGLDPFRDEGFLYEKVLRQSGVPTKFDVYPGQPHIFHEHAPLMTQSKKYLRDVQKGIAWLLQVK